LKQHFKKWNLGFVETLPLLVFVLFVCIVQYIIKIKNKIKQNKKLKKCTADEKLDF